MVSTKRKDPKGVVLKEHESYRADGRYEFKYRDKAGKRHCLYASSLKELREKEEKLAKDAYKGIAVENRNITINDVYEKWIKLKVGLKENVRENYKYMYEAFVRDDFGKRKITSVKKSDVREFYLHLADQRGLKARTLEVIQTVLYPVFDMAIEDEMIVVNPAKSALTEIKKSKNYASKKKEALTVKQQEAFEEYLEQTPEEQQWRPIFITMLYTGLRVGEVTGLTKNNILDDKIVVDHTLVYYDKRTDKSNGMTYAINTPKTKAGNREIHMLSKVKEALQLQETYLEEADIKRKAVVDGYTDFVFVNRFGENLNQGVLNKALRRIVRDYNLREIEKAEKEKREAMLLPRITNHILRHTFGTRMMEKGINVKAIQTILGHTDIQTTLDIYTDAQSDFTKNELEKME